MAAAAQTFTYKLYVHLIDGAGTDKCFIGQLRNNKGRFYPHNVQQLVGRLGAGNAGIRQVLAAADTDGIRIHVFLRRAHAVCLRDDGLRAIGEQLFVDAGTSYDPDLVRVLMLDGVEKLVAFMKKFEEENK